ncbi:hypothetical protein HELRODRAFT_88960 [Helobdella robusta]|uniref:NTF2-related export protein n=1 Tax=Helobdella robusta TaxID=6412 RepID=T1G777_HELRO|nr:hypothetical protein HELRODRAFT_88960 [Helobdella robusta]ESN93340.1 hypothetical protein HELRODRAFT_88960 [Helobdella robusta]
MQDLKMRISLACEGAENFVKFYYERFDKSRHIVSKLYSVDAKLIWEGNAVVGLDSIAKFHENLPTSLHVVETIDAQPISGFATNGQDTFVVVTAGTVKFHDNKPRSFYQTFTVTSLNSKDWKVKSDCFRLMPIDTKS